MSPVDSALFRSHGLSAEDETLIVTTLGRTPTYAELGVFSVLWSEHCSYRTTRSLLATLPTKAPHVVHGPGENAGVVDLGDGLVAVCKIESHNHPSQIEPFHGAATGVGGILRDVFTMGARPCAVGVALRLGPRGEARNDRRNQGIVAGIGAYGNAIGVPTVTADLGFHEAFADNVLVNAFACGIARRDRLVLGLAEPVGACVVLLGSPTGRDGIHGATMASAAFGEDAPAQRTVQVGDPFAGKRVMETCLALAEAGLVTGQQDLGAAGLSSSTVEMAARTGLGLELWLGEVPRRAAGMSAYEVLLSESQERMIAVCLPENLAALEAVAARFETRCAVVGVVTDTGRWIVRDGHRQGPVVCDLDVRFLTHGAPARTFARGHAEARPTSLREAPRELLEQLDQTVGGDTLLGREGDAAVLRVGHLVAGGVEKRLALALGAPRGEVVGRAVGFSAVVEACLRLAAVGARPLAISDGLNFGSPAAPAVFDELVSAIEGLGDACRLLDVPVISGNVSLSNQTAERAIPPTPFVVALGLLPTEATVAPSRFDRANLPLWLLAAPDERALGVLIETLGQLAKGRVPRCVHVVSGGDVGRAIAEMSVRDDALDRAFGAIWSWDETAAFAAAVLVATMDERALSHPRLRLVRLGTTAAAFD